MLIDGKSSYSVIVSVELGAFEAMKIYPNPSNGNDLNMNVPFDGEYEVQIISASGQLLYSENTSGSSVSLRDLNLEGGVYLVRATDQSTSLTERLIVR
ncbi:MAG: hypothetical protein ACI837_001816 [Crocinitomicaceae bacterium]